MNSLIYYLSSYEATVRTDSSDDVGEIIAASGGFLFSLQLEGYYETPVLSVDDARACLENLEGL